MKAGNGESPSGKLGDGKAHFSTIFEDRSNMVRGTGIEHGIFSESTRRHHSNDVALHDRAGRQFRVFHLLADRSAAASGDNFGEILIQCRMREPGHGHGVFRILVTTGQGQAKNLSSLDGIRTKEFIKITHPKE